MDKPVRQTLPRKRMLQHTLDIRRVLQNGRRVSGKSLNIFLRTADCSRFAVLVPKRLGNAVLRNKMKRLAREIYRRNPNWFAGREVIFFIKRFNDDYTSLEREIHQLVINK